MLLVVCITKFFLWSVIFLSLSLTSESSGHTYPDFPIDSLRGNNYLFDQKCPKLVNYILDHQRKCQQSEKSGDHVAFICICFSSDIEFLLTSVIHHLLLGFRQVYLYNNDDTLPWFYHPTILCLLSAELIVIQPWFGDGVGVQGYDHCTKKIAEEIKHHHQYQKHGHQIGGGVPGVLPMPTTNLDHVWVAVFDIDEYVVLHKDQCITSFLNRMESYAAPSIAMNWAFFTPTLPLSKMGITQTNTSHPFLTFPFEELTTRMFENPHIKSMVRLSCLERWMDPHHAAFTASCPFGQKPIDPQGNRLHNHYATPFVDNSYPELQINHYWTISLAQYLRKIHRGYGPLSRQKEHYRSTIDLFNHLRGNLNPDSKDNSHKKVVDTSFLKYYGPRFEELKSLCWECFNLSYFFPQYATNPAEQIALPPSSKTKNNKKPFLP